MSTVDHLVGDVAITRTWSGPWSPSRPASAAFRWSRRSSSTPAATTLPPNVQVPESAASSRSSSNDGHLRLSRCNQPAPRPIEASGWSRAASRRPCRLIAPGFATSVSALFPVQALSGARDLGVQVSLGCTGCGPAATVAAQAHRPLLAHGGPASTPRLRFRHWGSRGEALVSGAPRPAGAGLTRATGGTAHE